jgi:hypothetical protein
MAVDEKIIFAWWNTGLSPVGRKRASDEEFQIASRIIRNLLREEHVDFLGLGEITKSDLDQLLRESELPNYTVYDGTLHEGRLQFDTGAIYNAARLKKIKDITSTIEHGKRKLKLANRIDFIIRDDNHPFHLFISHWPSHLTPDSEPLRIKLGARLRSSIDEMAMAYNGDARLIVMGDFNEEPFHESLENQLLATRDRKLAMKSSSHLYNPFWRHLGESEPYSKDSLAKSFAGTCFVAKGNTTRWKTVDQIIVSSAFLGSSPWHLNENLTKILYIAPRVKQDRSEINIFDHFPIIATIEKIKGEGIKNG